MKLKKILQNSVMETIFYLIIAVVGLLKVKYIIHGLGSEMNGYYQFINNIISYIVLAEAGISTAILYKMYRPVANNDYKKISELFNGSKAILKGIGIIFISIAVILLPVIYMYTKEIKLFITISFCFFMLVFAVALPYLSGTRSYTTLLTADQKRFTYGLVYNISRLLTDILIIFVVSLTNSIISIVIVNLLFKILETLVITSYCKKKYTYLDKSATPDKSAKKMSGDMIFHQVGYVIFNNVDTVLLMSFLGPVYVSIYSSYNYIVTFIRELFDKNNQMISNIFGYSFAKDDKKTLDYYKSYVSFFSAVTLVISFCFVMGARSFIKLWIDKPNYILNYLSSCSFAAIIVSNIILTNINTVIQANGLFKESRFFPIIESVVNIILSIILLKLIGINGILIATFIASLVGIFIRTNLINKKVFKKASYKSLIIRPIIVILSFVLLSIVLFPLESKVLLFSTNYFKWFLVMLVIFIIVLLVIFSVFYLFDHAMRNNFKVILNKVRRTHE